MAGAPSGTSSSSVHSTGWRMNGSVCGPPRPPCEPISSSNAATSPSSGSYWLSSSRSGAWTIASSRLRLMIVCGPNRVVGSSPSTRSWSRKRVPFGPKTTAPYVLRADQQHPDARVGRDRGDESRMERLELLDRESVVVAGEPDEPEVARADDGDRRRHRRRAVSSSSSSRLTTPSVVLLGQRGARDGRPDALGLGDLRQERVHEGRALGLASWSRPDGRPAAHQAADVLAEAHAVALQERLAEALAVVGQDDELVRPRRLVGRLDQRRDRAVHAVERLERLDPLGTAVVGELVVVGEVGVDDVGPAVHLVDDQRRC